MGNFGTYLARRLSGDLNALPVQALCIGLAALFCYGVLRKKKRLYHPPEGLTPGVQVFTEELGNWPQIFRQDDGGYWFVAEHWPPGWRKYDNDRSFAMCALGFAVLALALWFLSIVAAIGTVIAAIRLMRDWPVVLRHDPVLMMRHWGLQWFSPLPRGEANAPLTFKMRVQLPHRMASSEAREHERIIKQQALDRENALRRLTLKEQKYQDAKQDALRRLALTSEGNQRRHAANMSEPVPVRASFNYVPDPSPPRPEYQTASELIIMTGAGDHIWQVMAEFRDDEHGELANKLYHAINFVRNVILREMTAGGIKVLGLDDLDEPEDEIPETQQPPNQAGGPVEAFE